MKSYFVLDQNYLRSNELRVLIASDRERHFVLTDVAILEMCKSPQWESTLRASLAALSSCPERVHVSIGVGEACRIEMARWRCVEGRLLNREYRGFIREILNALAAGANSNNLSLMASRMASVQAGMHRDELDHIGNRARVEVLLDSTRQILSQDFLRGLRNGAIGREEKLKAMIHFAPQLISGFFEENSLSPEKQRSFRKQKPLLLRLIYLKLWLCFDWISRGGFEGQAGERVTNDLMDHDYVVISTFFSGILSRDGRVNEAYEDVMWMLAHKG